MLITSTVLRCGDIFAGARGGGREYSEFKVTVSVFRGEINDCLREYSMNSVHHQCLSLLYDNSTAKLRQMLEVEESHTQTHETTTRTKTKREETSTEASEGDEDLGAQVCWNSSHQTIQVEEHICLSQPEEEEEAQTT